jgi:thioredoxin reductase
MVQRRCLGDAGTETTSPVNRDWECVVVGGGAAGLTAALVLGRARRRTLVVDADEQSNRSAPLIGGLLGYDRRPPAELYAVGRQELAAYPTVEHRAGEVRGGAPVDDGYELELDDGSSVRTARVLLATGMQYCPTDIANLADFWGDSVFQCPFCHGWEMRDKRLAALASRGEGVHDALMLRGWSDDVVLLTNGPAELEADRRRLLEAAAVTIDERRVVELIGKDGRLSEIAFDDGGRLERDGLLVEAPLRQRTPLAEKLGVQLRSGSATPDQVDVDALHQTSVPNVFAAGDLCTHQPHVTGAIDSGSRAAMSIVQSLLADEYALPYPPT